MTLPEQHLSKRRLQILDDETRDGCGFNLREDEDSWADADIWVKNFMARLAVLVRKMAARIKSASLAKSRGPQATLASLPSSFSTSSLPNAFYIFATLESRLAQRCSADVTELSQCKVQTNCLWDKPDIICRERRKALPRHRHASTCCPVNRWLVYRPPDY